VADGLATGAVGTEDLAEEGPQGDGRGPQGRSEAAEADVVIAEALLDLLGVEAARQRQGVAGQEGRAGVFELESVGCDRGEWHGSLPCFIGKQGSGQGRLPAA